MKKLLFAAACCLAAAPAAAQSSNNYQPAASPSAGREQPAVRVLQPADAPLEVRVETKWAGEDEQGLEFHVVVTNASDRPVRAYTVRVAGVEGGEPGGGCLFHHAEKRGKILRPGRARGQSAWPAVPASPSQPEMVVSLDFVEFDGGDTWGLDTCRSADFLEGMRAGARAARDEFGRRLEAFGPDALLRQLDEEDAAPAPPDGHTEAWAQGFRGGVGRLRLRVRKAGEAGGQPEVEEALRRPFDASEDRP
jgi:hypothetical protein